MGLAAACFIGVILGAGMCFLAIYYATYRFQTETIRRSNWADRIDLYINIDRYLQDLQTYLTAFEDSIDQQLDTAEIIRKLRISARTFYNYVNENRGEIDLFLPVKVSKQVFDVQILSNMHMASQEETELYWDQHTVRLISTYIHDTIQLIKKDMKLY